jgi:hypothetical protein
MTGLKPRGRAILPIELGESAEGRAACAAPSHPGDALAHREVPFAMSQSMVEFRWVPDTANESAGTERRLQALAQQSMHAP